MAKERWITVNGNHILIKDGQSVNEAIKERFGKKDGGEYFPSKHIYKGKHEISEDNGYNWLEVDPDTYRDYEADEDLFDDNNEDVGERFNIIHQDIVEEKGKFDMGEAKKRLLDEGFDEDEIDEFIEDNYDPWEYEDIEIEDNDDVDSDGEENSISKGLTDLGRKTAKEANESGWGEAYDPMTGAISISEKDFAERKKDIQNWLDNHKNYKLVEDQVGDKWLTTDYENGEKELSLNSDESSPMNEFSGPDREGPSFAQLEAGKNNKKELNLEDAIKSADDDVLDSQFGKDSPERKLAGAIKGSGESQSNDEHTQLSNMLKEYGVEVKPTPTHQSKYEIKSNKLPFAKREEITKKLESLGYEVQGDGNGNLNIWNSLNENQYNNKRNDWIINDFLGQYGYKENLSPEERAVIAKILRLK